MRGMIPDASVDLVYLDPPFNSNATYNVLFKPPEELGDAAQIKAFEDTWHWTVQTEREYSEILKNPYGNADLANLISALKQFLGVNDMLAYLVHMANRLLEIRRVMKDTASIYLHCDPTASHYLKLVLDAVFGIKNFQNEIVWERTTGRKSGNQYGRVHDIIFFYSHTDKAAWNAPTVPHDDESSVRGHDLMHDEGGLYRVSDLTGAGQGPARKFGDILIEPTTGRHWQFDQAGMDELMKVGRIIFSKGGKPRLKTYINELPGVAVRDMWKDIRPINAAASERLGYPTQKPLALLERIVMSSSNEGDVVLDPFCGCGTTVHAAEELKRSWIGIDITHLAINIIRSRLTAAFPGIEIETHGLPASYAGALELARADKHEFELWVLGELDAMPYKGGRKGPDTGIDGYIFFRCLDGEKVRDGKAIVEVKGGGTTVKDVRNLDAVVEHEGANLGVLVSALKPTSKMREFAAGRGTVSLGTKEYPRLQVVWLKDLMENKARVEYPESGKIEHQKKAPRHRRDYQEEIGSES